MYCEIKHRLDESKIAYKVDECMCEHTSFKIGGKVSLYITPASAEQCANAVRLCREFSVPYQIIGKGTNLLVSDDGIEGAVICISSLMSDIKLASESEIVCQAGASLASVCLFALENSLSGMEFAYGIPGNVGGAVAMNAGAYGGEMKDIIVSCDYIDESGNIHTVLSEDMNLSYRHSIFSDNKWCVVSAKLMLSKGEKTEIKDKMSDFLGRRKDKQPLDFPSAGSTFKRPEGSYASLLIDQCGLKGYSVGGAKVSEKHAGFVINFDNATCEDVKKLVCDIQNIVYKKTGYRLETEIKML